MPSTGRRRQQAMSGYLFVFWCVSGCSITPRFSSFFNGRIVRSQRRFVFFLRGRLFIHSSANILYFALVACPLTVRLRRRMRNIRKTRSTFRSRSDDVTACVVPGVGRPTTMVEDGVTHNEGYTGVGQRGGGGVFSLLCVAVVLST